MTHDEWMDAYENWASYRECHAIEGVSPHYSERGVAFSNEDAVKLLIEAAALMGVVW